jgi:L-2-hydroxyglutarate oxidase LhgO
LIYPVPETEGLGIHVTLDLAGQMRFGPDVQWLLATPRGQEDYTVPPERAAAFAESIRRYWPGLPEGGLQPAYAGLRPKLPACDFLVSGPAQHGVPGLVNLMGIESPGLTSCLALAEAVVQQLAE